MNEFSASIALNLGNRELVQKRKNKYAKESSLVLIKLMRK